MLLLMWVLSGISFKPIELYGVAPGSLLVWRTP